MPPPPNLSKVKENCLYPSNIVSTNTLFFPHQGKKWREKKRNKMNLLVWCNFLLQQREITLNKNGFLSLSYSILCDSSFKNRQTEKKWFSKCHCWFMRDKNFLIWNSQPCFFCLKNQVNIFDGCETLTLYSNINKDDRGNEFWNSYKVKNHL